MRSERGCIGYILSSLQQARALGVLTDFSLLFVLSTYQNFIMFVFYIAY